MRTQWCCCCGRLQPVRALCGAACGDLICHASATGQPAPRSAHDITSTRILSSLSRCSRCPHWCWERRHLPHTVMPHLSGGVNACGSLTAIGARHGTPGLAAVCLAAERPRCCVGDQLVGVGGDGSGPEKRLRGQQRHAGQQRGPRVAHRPAQQWRCAARAGEATVAGSAGAAVHRAGAHRPGALLLSCRQGRSGLQRSFGHHGHRPTQCVCSQGHPTLAKGRQAGSTHPQR